MKDAKTIMAYARALLEVGLNEGSPTKLHAELDEFAKVITPELLSLSHNPDFSYQEKRAVLEAIAAKGKFSRPALAIVLMLTEHRNLHLIADILSHFRKLSLKAEGKALLEVTSATALKASDLAQIEKLFGGIVQKKFVVESHVDPKLMGGVVVSVGSKVYDGSIRGRLQKLSTELLA